MDFPPDDLLTKIANDLHVSTGQIKRWWPLRKKNGVARGMIILLTNGDQVYAGPKKNTNIWEACQPAIAKLDVKKSANGGKRVSHKDIEIGVSV